MQPEDISPSKFGGTIEIKLGDQQKPWRHMHHDYQPVDEVRIVTVPRYKTSGLSGDEWRISAKIQYLKKGVVIYERSTRNIESALRYGDWWLTEWLEQGNYSAGRTAEQCDQEGCAEPATVTYRLKNQYCRDGHPHEPHRPKITRFCDRHKTRGDCGLEDADRNYERVTLNPDGSISDSGA